MRHKLFTNLILALGLIACIAWEAKADQSLFEKEFTKILQYIANDQPYKALSLLNEALAEEPKATAALGLRSQIFLQIGDISAALADLETILAHDPNEDATRLYICVVKESQASDTGEALPCYQAAVESMRRRYTPEQLARNGNYVRLAILAELPEAESVRRKYLEGLDAANEFDAYEARIVRSFSHSTIMPLIETVKKAQDIKNKE